jgi:hypothetical protein
LAVGEAGLDLPAEAEASRPQLDDGDSVVPSPQKIRGLLGAELPEFVLLSMGSLPPFAGLSATSHVPRAVGAPHPPVETSLDGGGGVLPPVVGAVVLLGGSLGAGSEELQLLLLAGLPLLQFGLPRRVLSPRPDKPLPLLSRTVPAGGFCTPL